MVITLRSRLPPRVTAWPARFFFFSSRRRHTRCYRDWSSDVCSSDLFEVMGPDLTLSLEAAHGRWPDVGSIEVQLEVTAPFRLGEAIQDFLRAAGQDRSEERRVGKECRGGCARDRAED